MVVAPMVSYSWFGLASQHGNTFVRCDHVPNFVLYLAGGFAIYCLPSTSSSWFFECVLPLLGAIWLPSISDNQL